MPTLSPTARWTGRILSGLVVAFLLLGVAMATHLRAESPVVTHLLFGFYLGVIAWAGLWLRDARLRGLLPLMSSTR